MGGEGREAEAKRRGGKGLDWRGKGCEWQGEGVEAEWRARGAELVW